MVITYIIIIISVFAHTFYEMYAQNISNNPILHRKPVMNIMQSI